MADPIFGVDISHYQHGIALDQVAAEGFCFALCKLTQGATYVSPSWVAQRDGARAARLVLGAYHYIDGSDPHAQAANAAAHLRDHTIPIALDAEDGAGDITHIHAVAAAFADAGLAVALTYLPHWYWVKIGRPNLTGLAPLWASRYPSTAQDYAWNAYQGVTDDYWDGYGGLDVALLQFTASARVAGQLVDVSAFRGDADALAALLAAPVTPRPIPAIKPTNGAAMADLPAQVWAQNLPDPYTAPTDPAHLKHAGDLLGWAATHAAYARGAAEHNRDAITALATKLDALTARLDALTTGAIDPQVLAAAVLATLADKLH